MGVLNYLGLNFLIDAEDRSKAKFEEFKKNAKATADSVKDLSGRTKASTELAGSLAAVLGGGAFGAAAGEVAQLTDRISAFSEVGVKSKLGAIALKGAIALAVGAIAVKFGQAIGNSIWQVERWKKRLEEARQELKRLSDEALSAEDRRIGANLEEINLIADPRKRAQERNKFTTWLADEANALRKNIDRRKKEIEAMEDNHLLGLQTGEHLGQIEGRKAELEADQARLSLLRAKKTDLQWETSEYRKQIEAKREQIELDKKRQESAQSFVKTLQLQVEQAVLDKKVMRELQIRRAGLNAEQLRNVRILYKHLDAKEAEERQRAKAKKDQAEADRERAKNQAEMERVAKSRQSMLNSLQREIIAIRDGEQAAETFSLKISGVDGATAGKIASLKGLLKQFRDLKNKPAQKNSPLGQNNAVESRLLTGKGINDPVLQTAKDSLSEQRKANELLKNIERLFEEINRKNQKQLKSFGTV